TSIESEAFQYCRKLKTITIPANVKYIAPNAFEYCEGLETVIIDGCPEIKAEAFEYCSNLKTLIINDGCKSIGESAFAYCENLNDIYIAASVDKIDKRAFEYIGDNPVFHAPSGSKAERYANSMSYAHDNNI
ncbi:MAG: leucine-rich repeat domain-containing protein, partial [Ruminococcus sp.]|nr:leucine-rich repeat domain-containing protein [Ruminococcus sp.]